MFVGHCQCIIMPSKNDHHMYMYQARKVFVFILGGAVRSEVRVAYTRSGKLNREVVLVTTSLETPLSFMEKLARVGKHRFSV